MSCVDDGIAVKNLRDWQANHYSALSMINVGRVGPANVTLMAYFYRPTDNASEHFFFLEFAIRMTWAQCGFMKTTIVTNILHDAIRRFRAQFHEWVEVQIEESLAPGDLNAMSLDCNTKLHTRFNTEYALVVQDDGFPLRGGLENFLFGYDFIGGALRRDVFQVKMLGRIIRHWPSNGGFSLRTRRICRLAAEYWRRYYLGRPFGSWMSEDMFYTDTLPRDHFGYRWRVHIAESDVASRFSYDGSLKCNLRKDVLGFHSARAFRDIQERYPASLPFADVE